MLKPRRLSFPRAVWALVLAREKAGRLRAAERARQRGLAVVCDRFPQSQVLGFNDGPLLTPWLESPSALRRRLARYELGVYQSAHAARARPRAQARHQPEGRRRAQARHGARGVRAAPRGGGGARLGPALPAPRDRCRAAARERAARGQARDLVAALGDGRAGAPSAGARARGRRRLGQEHALPRARGAQPRDRAGRALRRPRPSAPRPAHAARLLPAWLASREPLPRREGAALAELRGRAGRRASSAARAAAALAVFDHGPLFRIARLRAFGPRLVESAAFRRWSEAAVRRWARLLDAVVWLDAPDALLAERIDARDERHRMKGGEAGETQRFLGPLPGGLRRAARRVRGGGRPRADPRGHQPRGARRDRGAPARAARRRGALAVTEGRRRPVPAPALGIGVCASAGTGLRRPEPSDR